MNTNRIFTPRGKKISTTGPHLRRIQCNARVRLVHKLGSDHLELTTEK
jgi:hypothetical protein